MVFVNKFQTEELKTTKPPLVAFPKDKYNYYILWNYRAINWGDYMLYGHEEKRTAQHQHINISYYAFKILQEDSLSFYGTKNLSGLINIIFMNYYQAAEASVSLSQEIQRKVLTNYIFFEKYVKSHPQDTDLAFYDQKGSLTEEESDTIEKILFGYSKQYLSRFSSYPKQHVMKIRLQNTVYDILYPNDGSEWPEAPYYRSPGDYLKAVLEEYVRKTTLDREAILYKDTLDILTAAIKTEGFDKRILTITYTPAEGQKLKYNIKPYFLTLRSTSGFYYLVALAADTNGENSNYEPRAFRVAWIKNIQIRPHSFGSGKITNAQKLLLEKTIKEKEISFLNDELCDFKVLLTPDGYTKYCRFPYQRPLADLSKSEFTKDGNIILRFHSTEMHITHFFFKFGKDAKILEPANVAENFKQAYKEAYLQYE